MCLILMKSDNQSKLNMLTMNILIAIDDLDWKLEIWESWSQTEMRSTFYEFWHLRQIKHADYEYSTWNWQFWLKMLELGKFGYNTKIFSSFYEIWCSQQIKHAYYEYTCQCLEHSHDYRLRMITGSEHGNIIRTIIVPIVISCSEWL